jgi:hypothetical protein
MERCALSIHLFPDVLPLTADNTRAGLEMRVARDLVEKRQIVAMAWAPKHDYWGSNDVVYGPLLECPENFDNLSTENAAGIRARIRSRLARPLVRGNRLRVFLIAHQQDRSQIQDMKNRIEREAQEYSFTLSPDFDAARYKLEDYRDFLDNSDVAIICWCDAPKSWFSRMQDTLLAHLGRDCNMCLNRCAVYSTKQRPPFVTSFERIVGESFQANLLRPFLSGLRDRKAKGHSL